MTLQPTHDASPLIPTLPSGRILRSGQLILIGLGFAALIVMAAASVILTQRNRDAFDLADHTQMLLADTAKSLELLEDAETGQRGFLLTEKQGYLDPYNEAINVIPGQLDQLVAEAAGFPIAGDTLKLQTAGLNKIAEMKETIALYTSDGSPTARRRPWCCSI